MGEEGEKKAGPVNDRQIKTQNPDPYNIAHKFKAPS